ncbi:hypothetical protein EDD86DRAFT_175774, partial [Gorgonomyces haynaldii]
TPNGLTADYTTCPGSNTWGLTFDDGPTSSSTGKDTNGILNVLNANGVKATFFVVGTNVVQNPSIVKRAYDAGHQIALHTWTHHPLTSLTNEQIVAEIKYNEAIIFKAIGKIPTLLRPPYGDIDNRVRAIAQALGYRIALWNKDSEDASQSSTSTDAANKVVQNIESWYSTSGSFISLQHDISPFTSGIAITALNDFFSTTRSLKQVPVGQCVGLPFYTD